MACWQKKSCDCFYISQLRQHSTLYIILQLRTDNQVVDECRVPLNSTFTLQSGGADGYLSLKIHKIHKVVLHKVVYFVNLRGCDGELVWVPEGVKVVADCCEIGVFCG